MKIFDWLARVNAAWQVLLTGENLNQKFNELGARIAELKLDLQDRDKEIKQLRQEYQLQREQSLRQNYEIANKGLENLVRQLAPPLSQLATMRVLANNERTPVRLEDLFKMCEKIDQILIKSGLIPIGQVGTIVNFDSRFHQRISGIDLNDGDQVVIRFIGYRLGETILLKAMVNYYNSEK